MAALVNTISGWVAEHTDGGVPDFAQLATEAAASGGGQLTVWVSASAESERAAFSAGFAFGRDLLQLRRPLPLGPHGAFADVRPFEVGRDEAAWLDVNRRSFAHHAEQGSWDRATLDERITEPWFDAAGFLLHEIGGRLAGFCWTKVHAAADPPQGEIYVIGVDPDFGGRGLGTQLTIAGLDHLAARGLTVGMLYVDADNAPARAMYDRLGFTTHHVNRSYVRDVSPTC